MAIAKAIRRSRKGTLYPMAAPIQQGINLWQILTSIMATLVAGSVIGLVNVYSDQGVLESKVEDIEEKLEKSDSVLDGTREAVVKLTAEMVGLKESTTEILHLLRREKE